MTNKFSIYASEPLLAALSALGDRDDGNRSARINVVCERYLAIVADELKRLKFSKGEWCAIMDANNGAQVYLGGAALFPSMIWANVHDSPELEDKWKIDQAALVRRLQALPPSSLIAIQEACDRFWSRTDKPTDEALAAAGVKFS